MFWKHSFLSILLIRNDDFRLGEAACTSSGEQTAHGFLQFCIQCLMLEAWNQPWWSSYHTIRKCYKSGLLFFESQLTRFHWPPSFPSTCIDVGRGRGPRADLIMEWADQSCLHWGHPQEIPVLVSKVPSECLPLPHSVPLLQKGPSGGGPLFPHLRLTFPAVLVEKRVFHPPYLLLPTPGSFVCVYMWIKSSPSQILFLKILSFKKQKTRNLCLKPTLSLGA